MTQLHCQANGCTQSSWGYSASYWLLGGCFTCTICSGTVLAWHRFVADFILRFV